MSDVKPWPIHPRETYPPEFNANSDQWRAALHDYERARADAAMSRLRVLEKHAREVLQWRNAFFDWTQKDPECFCSSEVLCDFDNLEWALKEISPLPHALPEETKGE